MAIKIFVTGSTPEKREEFITSILHEDYWDLENVIFTTMVIKGRSYNIDIWSVNTVDEIREANYVILLESEGMPITHEVDIPCKFCIQEYENYAKETVLPYTMYSLGYLNL